MSSRRLVEMTLAIWWTLSSRIRFWSAWLTNMISRAATRPLPSARGSSTCETTARSVIESCVRICDCWCGGNESMMRVTVCAADCVAMVEITRLPVSAAVRAIAMLDRSRISPTKMMCGAWRSAPLSPRA